MHENAHKQTLLGRKNALARSHTHTQREREREIPVLMRGINLIH